MNEVLAFLLENRIVYLATVDGNIPKVRPVGFVMEFEGKLYFSTSNQKNVYKQLKANPNFEVSIISKTGDWLRLKGKLYLIPLGKPGRLPWMPCLLLARCIVLTMLFLSSFISKMVKQLLTTRRDLPGPLHCNYFLLYISCPFVWLSLSLLQVMTKTYS